jgi:hypothetical protein
MTAIRIFAAVILSLGAIAAYAQNPVTPAVPAASAASSTDCAAAKKDRHDHGVERGTGPAGTKGCATTAATKANSKPIKGHDHAKFHKNQ